MPRRRPPISTVTVRTSALVWTSAFVVTATATATAAALYLLGLPIVESRIVQESDRHVPNFPPGAVPFEFNGVTYYILPLDSAK